MDYAIAAHLQEFILMPGRIRDYQLEKVGETGESMLLTSVASINVEP
jgi:hypothetical protein